MGSATMAFNKILVSVLLGSVAGQNTRTFPGFGLNSDVPSTTPVPILRYIDQQNNDGSYTYGYQSGDGSYKIETRLATGEVKGKYGYIDANGNLKETSYGAMADLGFQPIVDGVEYNVQVPEPAQNDIATNTIDFSSSNTNFVQKAAVVNNNNAGQFANFRPNNNNNAKIVNGRRAVLRKRLRVRPEDAIRPSDLQQQREEKEQIEAESREAALRAREEGLRARQEGLRVLEQQRAALRRLQGDLISGAPVRSQASRSFPAFQQQQRPAPANFQEAPRSDPYVSGIDLYSGSYSVQY